MADWRPIIDGVEGGFSELPEPICGVGKLGLVPKLTESLNNLPFLVCGPPGCGKKSLLQIAAKDANLKVKGAYDLGHISSEKKTRYDDLVKVLNRYGGRLQKNLMGEKCLLLLYGAEHLDKEGAALVRKYDVVLIASEQTVSLKAAFGDRTLWANRLTRSEMEHSLAILHPEATSSQVRIATQLVNGDLRQAQIHITFGTTNLDKAKHVYFDVRDALCKGLHKEIDWHGRRWTSENHLLVDKSIQEHATFSENLLTISLIEDPDREHAVPNCIGNIADVVAGMAVKKLVGYKRAEFKLKSPPDCHKCQISRKRKYPECWADVKQYFNTPQEPSTVGRKRKRGGASVAALPDPMPAPCSRAANEMNDMNATMVEPSPKAAASSATETCFGAVAQSTLLADSGGDQPDEMRIFSGHPEYDLLKGWGLYRTNLRAYHTSTTMATFPTCHDAPADLRNSKWLVVSYSQDAPLELITKTLEENLPGCLIDAVSVDDANIVFMYKSSQQNIRSRLKVGVLEPNKVQVTSMCKGKGRSHAKNAQKDSITHFQQLSGKHVTNMHLGKASDVDEYTAKTLLHAVKDMTSEAFTNFVLDARLKEDSGEELSELERILCNDRIESRVKELRKLSSKVVTNVVYASKVKETGQVQPERVFKNTWKKLLVTIHDKSLLTPLMPREGNHVTLETFLKFPELHQNVTLFMPGESRTGKTELAKFICLQLAVKYQNEDPRFLMTNTLDSLRINQALMLPGVPVLLDDIGGDDNDHQLIYSSISMWKAILQVKDATQNRARNDDLMWASRQPKVMTSNCLKLDDWIEVMFPRAKSSHKQAIVLRTAEIQTITDTLYSNSSASSASTSFLPSKMSTKAASEYVASLFE